MAKLTKEQIMVGDEMVQRGVSIRGVARQLGVTEGALRYQLRLTAVSVAANGPLAIERGVYTMIFTPPGAAAALSEDGNYLIHWRQTDGRWLRVSQFASSPNPIRLPPPAK